MAPSGQPLICLRNNKKCKNRKQQYQHDNYDTIKERKHQYWIDNKNKIKIANKGNK